MCLQCCTQAVLIGSEQEQEILPGWALYRATVDYFDEWKAGQYGLVRVNDPDFIFSLDFPDLPLDEIDEVKALSFLNQLGADAVAGYCLVAAAIKAGFNPTLPKAEPGFERTRREGFLIDYTAFALWLYRRVVSWVATHPALSFGEEHTDEADYTAAKEP